MFPPRRLTISTARTVVRAAAAVALALSTASADAGPSEADLQEARSMVQDFATQLKGELQTAMQDGGTVNAIQVCRQAAPSIAGELSTKSSWAVGRTALKVRNPRNAPSVRERAVLMDFKRRADAGEALAKMEDAAVIEEDGRRYLHYMKAIPTGEACLACHGSELPDDLAKAIRTTYPADAATGFEKGELRGAFTFVKPLPAD